MLFFGCKFILKVVLLTLELQFEKFNENFKSFNSTQKSDRTSQPGIPGN